MSGLPSTLSNSVFQGTVLGPPLWNVYYQDARRHVNDVGFLETVFADDLLRVSRSICPTDMCSSKWRNVSSHCISWVRAIKCSSMPERNHFTFYKVARHLVTLSSCTGLFSIRRWRRNHSQWSSAPCGPIAKQQDFTTASLVTL